MIEVLLRHLHGVWRGRGQRVKDAAAAGWAGSLPEGPLLQ